MNMASSNSNDGQELSQVTSISKLRRYLPQILAGSACNLLLMDLSAVVYFSTVIIGRLHDSKGPIVLDDDRASWIGSIHFICQPLGSLASGVLTELMGRKRVMVLLNIPFLVGWVLIWLAPSYEVLLVANVIHGLSMGLVEAPICTYVGEVCEPDIRGIMGTSGGIFYQVGSLFVLLLGTLTDWRTTAGISIAIPILTGICLLFVPEAPIWLVSKGRVTEAQKSLCLLRGWVEPKDIQKEYEELLHFQEKTEQNGVINDGFEDEHNSEIPKENVEIPHKEENYLLYRVKEMWEPVTRRPIILIVVFMFLITWSGYIAARPYMVTVLDKFEMPLRSDWSTVIQGVTGVLGALCVTGSVHRLGKRTMSISGQIMVTACTLLFGVYCLAELSPSEKDRKPHATWTPLLLFAIMSFLNSCVGMIPWSMLCEVFPFRTRSVAAGICSATYYLFTFATAKSYLSLQSALDLHGVFWLYTLINAGGLVYLYLQLPETEGKSLTAIQHFFATGQSARSQHHN